MITIHDFSDEDNPINVIVSTYTTFSKTIEEHLNKELTRYRWIYELDKQKAYIRYVRFIRQNDIYKIWIDKHHELSTLIIETYGDIFDEWMFDSLEITCDNIINQSFEEIWQKIGPRPKWLRCVQEKSSLIGL